MVDVAMRDQNGVELLDVRPQSLLAKIDRGIDEDLFVAVFDQNRNAQPFVARVVGKAGFAVAGDRRNAGRSACA